MPDIVSVLIVLLIIAIVWWGYSQSIHIIGRWADRNGLQLVSSSRCYWTLGTPFWAALNQRNRTLYRITVADSVGNRMSGYALCGGAFLGMWSDRVEVKWDDSPDFE